MSFKSWLKEEKGGGGLGAFLIVVIIAAAIYAVQFGPSNLLYEPESEFAEAEFITPEESYENDQNEYTGNAYPPHNKVNTTAEPLASAPIVSEPSDSEDKGPAEESKITANTKVNAATKNKSKVSNTAKAKTKLKAKPIRNRLSNEELVKRKLNQGKTVKQIAAETGLDKRYIREVRRRNQQVVW